MEDEKPKALVSTGPAELSVREAIDEELLAEDPESKALVIESARSSAFDRHRRSMINLGAVVAHGIAIAVIPIFVLSAGFAFGVPGVLASCAAIALGTAPLLNRTLIIGNERLRRRIAERIGSQKPGEIFVGLLLPDNNTVNAKFFTPRLETDDNAGFLSIQGDKIVVRTEEGTIEVKREAVRAVEQERYIELPYLRWVIVEHFTPHGVAKLYVSSREGRSLRDMRRATESLQLQLREWFVDELLREHGLLEPGS